MYLATKIFNWNTVSAFTPFRFQILPKNSNYVWIYVKSWSSHLSKAPKNGWQAGQYWFLQYERKMCDLIFLLWRKKDKDFLSFSDRKRKFSFLYLKHRQGEEIPSSSTNLPQVVMMMMMMVMATMMKMMILIMMMIFITHW